MKLSLYHKAHILAHFIRWRLTWDRRDTDYVPRGLAQLPAPDQVPPAHGYGLRERLQSADLQYDHRRYR